MRFTCTQLITLSLLAVLAIAASIYFIDKEVASGIWRFTSSHPVLHKRFENIPNTLPKLVVIATTVMWLTYYFVVRRKEQYNLQKFLQLAATSAPVAYLIKIFLQNAFGRTNVRLWLRSGAPVEFRWFSPIEGGGFPSGHTIVFAAFFTAVWLYYPRYRWLVVAALIALAMALLFTSYHFVSDIIAGTLCGVLITAGIHYFLAQSYQSSLEA